jgi:hypothetical protein
MDMVDTKWDNPVMKLIADSRGRLTCRTFFRPNTAFDRRLQRPCFLLRPEASGEVAAVWHERDDEEILEVGDQCWLTIDARCVPGLIPPLAGFISVFTKNLDEGRVEISRSWPERRGTKLYAHPASILPPLDAVFARGSEAVDEWLRANWERGWPYNRNFKDRAPVEGTT